MYRKSKNSKILQGGPPKIAKKKKKIFVNINFFFFLKFLNFLKFFFFIFFFFFWSALAGAKAKNRNQMQITGNDIQEIKDCLENVVEDSLPKAGSLSQLDSRACGA
jgi:hypothetical protein